MHKLFNELHKQMCAEAEKKNDHDLKELANRIDELHYEYQDILEKKEVK